MNIRMRVRLHSFAIPLALLALSGLIPSIPAATQNTDAEKRALRAQLERMKTETQALDARLRELETPSNAATPPSEPRQATGKVQAAPESSMPAAAPTVPTYAPSGPALRQASDPAPYEAATDARLSMFRIAWSPFRWIPVGTRQLALFNTYDQAYLLDFANDCPGLLFAARIRFEEFATHVRAGEHAVIADGRRCPITNIRELRISKLPKALRP